MKRSSWIIGALVVLLAVIVYFVLQRPGESSVAFDAGRNLVQYDSAAVDMLTITSGRDTVVLEKQAGVWTLQRPMQYHADGNAVATAVGKGANIVVSSLISSNPEKQIVFQVDSTSTLVRVYANGAEKAAFRVGKPGPSFTETYVRREGSNDVYLAKELLTYVFAKPAKDWRDKTIFKTERDSIREVRFQFGDTTFTLARTDTTWSVESQTAAEGTIASFLSSLSNFLADDFIDSVVTAPPKLTGVLEVRGVQLRFHFNKDANKYFVQSSEGPQWFIVQPYKAQQVLKRKKELLPPGA